MITPNYTILNFVMTYNYLVANARMNVKCSLEISYIASYDFI